jgi:hypothetical protein
MLSTLNTKTAGAIGIILAIAGLLVDPNFGNAFAALLPPAWVPYFTKSAILLGVILAYYGMPHTVKAALLFAVAIGASKLLAGCQKPSFSYGFDPLSLSLTVDGAVALPNDIPLVAGGIVKADCTVAPSAGKFAFHCVAPIAELVPIGGH